jgi:hypothetical protein
MYGSYPYALAQTLVELPYSIVQGGLYSLITYFMFYFFIDAGKLRHHVKSSTLPVRGT